MRVFTFFLFLYFFSLSCFGQKSSRLVAYSAYNYNGAAFYPIDSINYIYYHPYLGGDLNSIYLPYNDAEIYRYDTSLMAALNVRKSLQTFDSKNHRTATTDYLWTGVWTETQNALYVPTTDDSISSKINQTWNTGTHSWINTAKQEYTYDVSRNRTAYISYNWDAGAGSWTGNEKFIYNYDVSNNLIQKNYQKWNTATSSWDNNYVDSFTYSVSNKVLEDVYWLWDKTIPGWKKFKKTSYLYDASDFLVSQILYAWDATLMDWVNGQKIDNTNDVKGNVLEQVTQNWNKSTVSWDNQKKQINVYDSRNNKLNEIKQYWDAASSTFINGQQLSNTFNSGNNLTTQIARLWDISSNTWATKVELDTYSYNTYNQLIYTTYFSVWDVVAARWTHGLIEQELHYYYQDYASDIAENKNEKGDLLLYPVPSQNELNIKMQWKQAQSFTCRIMDIRGSIMKQWNIAPVISYNESITLPGFAPGTYFIVIEGDKDGLITKSFVIAH